MEHLHADHSVASIIQKLDNDWSWKTESYYKEFSHLVLGDTPLNYINNASGKAYSAERLIKKTFANLTGWLFRWRVLIVKTM